MSAFGQEIMMNSPRPQGFTKRQTRGAANNAAATAEAAGNQRLQMKQYDRAGLSRGKGQKARAAASAATNYAQGMMAAEQQPLQDAASNANLDLNYMASQNQQGLALSRALEQQRHNEFMARLQRQSNATGYLGGLLSGLIG